MDKLVNNRYQIIKMIGTGGMADVYLADDIILCRKVALKIIRLDLVSDPISLLRFQREAKSISKMDHQNIVQVFDVGEYNGRPYIVMEYVAGSTLKQLLQKRVTLPLAEVISIMKQLASALEHAHQNNIVHRDIKPHNILIKHDGSAKITDFGIAIAHDAMQITANDTVLGSAHYLAPEITNGEEATKLSDIYSLGIVFFELIMGQVPFNGKTPVQVAMAHINNPLPNLRKTNSTIPYGIEKIITKACEKDVKLRYQSCTEILSDLNHWQNIKEEHTIEKKSLPKWMIPTICVGVLFMYSGILFVATRVNKPIQKVMVPNIVGKSKQEAIEILNHSGIRMNIVQEKETNEFAGDVIFEMSVLPNTVVDKNTVIDVGVSKGRVITLPDFKNKSISEVFAFLLENNISMKVEEEYVSSSQKSGSVIEQSIKANTSVALTNETVLKLKIAVEPKYVIMPNLIEKEMSEAETTLKELGIKVETIKSGKVIKQSIKAYSVIAVDEKNVVQLTGDK